MEKTDFISTAELAKILRVSKQTAVKIAKTQLKTYKFTAGKNSPLFVKESDVWAWIEKGGCAESTADKKGAVVENTEAVENTAGDDKRQKQIWATIAAANTAYDSWQRADNGTTQKATD